MTDEVFTPIDEYGKRHRFQLADVRVIAGELFRRDYGWHARIEVGGKQYEVYGRDCGLPDCVCDAVILPAKGEIRR